MFPIVKEESKRYDKLLLELMDDHAHEDSVGRQLEDLVSLLYLLLQNMMLNNGVWKYH